MLVPRRLAGFLFAALLFAFLLPQASCGIMEPGNLGWFCETDSDCNDDLTCETYVYEGSDHENQLCTGEQLLERCSSNYGWILLIAAWIFLVLLPILVLILVIMARIKNRGPTEREPPES